MFLDLAYSCGGVICDVGTWLVGWGWGLRVCGWLAGWLRWLGERREHASVVGWSCVGVFFVFCFLWPITSRMVGCEEEGV